MTLNTSVNGYEISLNGSKTEIIICKPKLNPITKHLKF